MGKAFSTFAKNSNKEIDIKGENAMRVVLSGGGTAGHIYPAIQTGLYLKKHCDAKIFYLGRPHSLEEKIAKENQIPFFHISSKGLNKKHLLSFGAANVKGVAQSVKWLRQLKPDYLFTTGGYVSAPVLSAAMLLRIPYSIHEQNAVSGKVNKLFTMSAKTIFISFPAMENKQVFYSGNPVRYTQKLEKNGEKVVFFGGSGGAQSINEAAFQMASQNPNIPMVLVTGEKRYESFIKSHPPLDNLTIHDYVSDPLPLYKEAKILVSRSGSGALFEIANLGIPNILIPFAAAAGNHQLKNAEHFTKRGGSLLVEEHNLHTKLEPTLHELWNNEHLRQTQLQVLHDLAKRNCVENICRRINKDLHLHYSD